MTWVCFVLFFAFTTLLPVNVSYTVCCSMLSTWTWYMSVGIMLGSSSQIGWKVEPVRNDQPGVSWNWNRQIFGIGPNTPWLHVLCQLMSSNVFQCSGLQNIGDINYLQKFCIFGIDHPVERTPWSPWVVQSDKSSSEASSPFRVSWLTHLSSSANARLVVLDTLLLTKKIQVKRLDPWKIWGNPHLYRSF